MKTPGIAALALLASLLPAQAEPFTAKMLATLDRLSEPRISPDSRYVLYDMRTVDYDANKASHSLWVVDLRNKSTRRLKASDGGTSNGRWAPDGSIYFISGRNGGIDQVFRTDATGDKAVQVTKAELDVGTFEIAPDGKTLVISQAVFPDCPDIACTVARKKAKADSKQTGVVYDRLFVRHWDSWADGTRNHLYAVKLDAGGVATGAPVPLMPGFDGDTPNKPFGDDGDFTISPDSKTVVFSAKVAGKTEAWSTNFDLWLVPIDGSKPPQDLTTANLAWDAGPVFSPDGKWLAYRAMKRPGFESDRFAIMLREVSSGKTHEVDPGWDRSADTLQFSHDGKTLFATADDIGQHRLFAVNVSSGAVKPITGKGHMDGFDVGTRNLVYAQDNLYGPAQLYETGLSGGKAVQLTHADETVLKTVKMGHAEQFAFTGWNGETVHGYVVQPYNYEPGKKYPVAFLIHGGPQGSMANEFHYRWNPQVYAGAGYAAVMIDFHGSTGYGQAFTDSISRHWGDRPLEDLQKGWAYALQKYPFLDGGHACALGASYGGYMINWIAGVWNEPWNCLVSHDGQLDSRAMAYSTEELWFDEWENGGSFTDDISITEKFNPILHIKDWKKPMMIVHSDHDYRIPLSEGLGSFTVLQRRGIPSKLLYFPDENHWVQKPQNSVQWHAEVIGWLDKWTK